MKVVASHSPSPGDFDFLTEKQVAVLDLLANNRTSKEIAWTLGVSETAVNRRVEVIRSRLGGVTRQEVARRYREWKATRSSTAAPTSGDKSLKDKDTTCVDSETRILQLAGDPTIDTETPQDGEASAATFEDPVTMSIDAPWKEWKEPRIVPRVLDGDNATFTRGAAIGILLTLILASLILAITVAQSLADAVR
jgi:DNA-binding CsgD family transcriptional regulator